MDREKMRKTLAFWERMCYNNTAFEYPPVPSGEVKMHCTMRNARGCV
ncbi:MAG: hypothetical protein K5705_16130 [Oscillospiraceae bacterium]|nr:hypothetical protein [Oscillospiraceae bacterium]